MISSNEPGYYRTGAWGIRTENLLLVVSIKAPEHAEREMLAFETLTLAPIDRSLVDTALLTTGERQWLDDYHARVRASVGPKLDPDARAWVEKATAPPIGRVQPPDEKGVGAGK